MGICHAKDKTTNNRSRHYVVDATDHQTCDTIKPSTSHIYTHDGIDDDRLTCRLNDDHIKKVAADLSEFIDPDYSIVEAIKKHPLSEGVYNAAAVNSRILLNTDAERYRYFGEMRGGLKQGFGILYNLLTGCLVAGYFKYGLPDGRFQVYHPDGKYEEINFSQGMDV